MKEIESVGMLVNEAQARQLRISDIVLEYEAAHMETTQEALLERMAETFNVMKESILQGLNPNLKSISGLTGGGAYKLLTSIKEGKLPDDFIHKAMVKALAASEYNASMGRIVAAPTAGSCGIIPAVLVTAMEEYKIPEPQVIKALFTTAGIGLVIAKKASISGAEGGCMAECGAASAMAAAALVELMGGTPQMASHAVAIALENSMGLVCDPVAGLVEVPCVMRNASGASNAITSAHLALAGLNVFVPADEVILASGEVGRGMPCSLKETADGGIAATPTAQTVKL
ncbi:MAG: L-serine ammonia-lyase, iron-sulfur-dependent, subunit alpha [Clostridia bacterium]|nr:L-serine ammonia-lyase, iron-sulfur-dependent, subunit alpha [Clostridia bacterium]